MHVRTHAAHFPSSTIMLIFHQPVIITSLLNNFIPTHSSLNSVSTQEQKLALESILSNLGVFLRNKILLRLHNNIRNVINDNYKYG